MVEAAMVVVAVVPTALGADGALRAWREALGCMVRVRLGVGMLLESMAGLGVSGARAVPSTYWGEGRWLTQPAEGRAEVWRVADAYA
jgi:hypothetical protein